MSARIAIIGAGLGGIALATLLRRMGHQATIYEQAGQFARVGAGIQMGANATKALRGLGVLDRLRQIGFRPESLLNRDHDTGAVSNELPGGEALELRYGSPHMCLHRADLHGALEALLEPGTVQLGRKLARYEQAGAGVVLHFSDGTREMADALIGADGVHSTVRAQMIGPDLPRFTGRVSHHLSGKFAGRAAQSVAHQMVGAGPAHRDLLHHRRTR